MDAHSGPERGAELARSGSPAPAPMSNMAGTVEVWFTVRLEASLGTNHSGNWTPVFGEGAVAVLGGSVGSVIVTVVSSRGSRNSSCGLAPLLVMVTGTVTAVPAFRVVAALSGSAGADALEALNTMSPLYGWNSSLPATGSANSMISVHLPDTGFTAYADAPSMLTAPVVPGWPTPFWP